MEAHKDRMINGLWFPITFLILSLYVWIEINIQHIEGVVYMTGAT